MVVLDGRPSLRGDVRLAAGPSSRPFPNATAGLTNKIAGQKVRVTVHSMCFQAWGRYFRQTTNGYDRIDPVEATASVTFPPEGTGPSAFSSGIVATAGFDGTGSAYIKQAQVFGGVVTGTLTVDQAAAIHYDEALRKRTIPNSPGVSRIEYLHVGVHHVNVTDG